MIRSSNASTFVTLFKLPCKLSPIFSEFPSAGSSDTLQNAASTFAQCIAMCALEVCACILSYILCPLEMQQIIICMLSPVLSDQ